MPKRKSSANEKLGPSYRKVMKPQKKYHTKAVKTKTGRDILDDGSEDGHQVASQIDIIFKEEKKKSQKKEAIEKEQKKAFEKHVLDKIAQLEAMRPSATAVKKSTYLSSKISPMNTSLMLDKKQPSQLTAKKANEGFER